jgi:hypothetical protein
LLQERYCTVQQLQHQLLLLLLLLLRLCLRLCFHEQGGGVQLLVLLPQLHLQLLVLPVHLLSDQLNAHHMLHVLLLWLLLLLVRLLPLLVLLLLLWLLQLAAAAAQLCQVCNGCADVDDVEGRAVLLHDNVHLQHHTAANQSNAACVSTRPAALHALISCHGELLRSQHQRLLQCCLHTSSDVLRSMQCRQQSLLTSCQQVQRFMQDVI